MRLGPVVYFQQGLEIRPCHEIVYKRCMHIMCALFCVFLCKSIVEIS